MPTFDDDEVADFWKECILSNSAAAADIPTPEDDDSEDDRFFDPPPTARGHLPPPMSHERQQPRGRRRYDTETLVEDDPDDTAFDRELADAGPWPTAAQATPPPAEPEC